MAIPEVLERLLSAPGPSGQETLASEVWREAAASFGTVENDVLGSSGVRVSTLTMGGPSDRGRSPPSYSKLDVNVKCQLVALLALGPHLSRLSAGVGTLVGMEVLVVDDEPSVRQALQRALTFEGYDVLVAPDGHTALDTLLNRPADAILLDVAMPGIDGLEVCRRLRAAGDRTPILMLTARHATADRVAGLDAGADDYLVKPFALEELLARLRALLRRATPPAGEDEVLRVADLSLDPATRVVKRGDRLIELTRTEFNLLELLLRNAGQVLTRELIFDRVWGYDFGANSNSLEVYIGYLRRKTEADNEPRLIHTVRGVGYVLRESPSGA